MTIRTFQAAMLIACSAMTIPAQQPEAQDPEPFTAISVKPQDIKTTAANMHGPSLVAYSGGVGLASSTGNLYFTDYGINEFGPSFTGFYRTGKYSPPASAGLLYGESNSDPAFFYFGNVVWAKVAGTYYGYFVANYDYGASGPRISQIKRVPLGGGSPVILGESPEYIGVGDLATDGATLFWTDAGGIRRMPINGGAIHTLVSTTSFPHIGLDPNYLYYSEGAGISRVAKGGGAPTVVLVTAANVTALYIDVQGLVATTGAATTKAPALLSGFHPPTNTFIFWGEKGGAVRSNNVGGSAPWTYQNPIPGRDVTSVGFDGMRTLWIDCAEPGNTQCNVKAQSGGSTITVDAGVGGRTLQWDAASVYWIGVPGIQRYVY